MSRSSQMNHKATPYKPRHGSQRLQWRPTTRGSVSDITQLPNPPLPVVNNRNTQTSSCDNTWTSSRDMFRTSFPTGVSSHTHQTQEANMTNTIPYNNYQKTRKENSVPRDNQDPDREIIKASKLLSANLRKLQQEVVIRPTGGAAGASKLIPASEAPPCMVRNGLPLIFNSKGVNWEHAPLSEFQRVSGQPKSLLRGTRIVTAEPNYTTRRLRPNALASTTVDRVVEHVRIDKPTRKDVPFYHLLMLPTDLVEELDK